MKILIPKNNFNAVSYTLRCLFQEFLGVNISIIKSESVDDYLIEYGDRTVTIANVFFKGKSSELYRKKNIPTEVNAGTIEFAGKNFPIVSIYGRSNLTYINQNRLRLESDIVGSTFFMLSRWEEAVIEEYDHHERFDYDSGLSVRMGFYQRAVVNEYTELVWQLCLFLNPKLKRKERKYTCTLTSDIDQLRKWKKPKRLFESVYINLINGKWNRAWIDISNYFGSLSDPKKDFYNNLDYLARKSRGLKTVFYLKTNYSHPKHDKNRYDLQEYAEELEEVKAHGVELGIHPHYHSYLDKENLIEEVENLNSFEDESVNLVRQHFLRFSVPETWQYQAEAGLKEDSTMIYPHCGGFRNGVCYSFPVFDFLADQELEIYESPLILMETAYLSGGFGKLMQDAKMLISEVKKYKGNFVMLWHNGNLVYPEQRYYFEKLIEMAKS